MAHVLLFHHVMGLTEGVRAFADRLRAGGHEVTLPDLYGGRVFNSIEEGMEHSERIGSEMIAEAGAAAARNMPEDLVYAGLSMGVMPAMKLLQQRPGAKGALFFHGIVPLGFFGNGWPSGVPLQIHILANDPYEDMEEVRAFADATRAELFLYNGGKHLFTDSSKGGYDPRATDLVVERSLKLLADL